MPSSPRSHGERGLAGYDRHLDGLATHPEVVAHGNRVGGVGRQREGGHRVVDGHAQRPDDGVGGQERLVLGDGAEGPVRIPHQGERLLGVEAHLDVAVGQDLPDVQELSHDVVVGDARILDPNGGRARGDGRPHRSHRTGQQLVGYDDSPVRGPRGPRLGGPRGADLPDAVQGVLRAFARLVVLRMRVVRVEDRREAERAAVAGVGVGGGNRAHGLGFLGALHVLGALVLHVPELDQGAQVVAGGVLAVQDQFGVAAEEGHANLHGREVVHPAVLGGDLSRDRWTP